MIKKVLSLIICVLVVLSAVCVVGCNDSKNNKGGIVISKDTVNMIEGTQIELDYTINNLGEDRVYSITTSNKSVVEITEDGKLKGACVGSAIVTINTLKGFSDSCVVIVEPVWGYGVETTKATCDTDGIITFVNAITGETKTEISYAFGHDYQYSETVPATNELASHDLYVCTHDSSHTVRRNYRGNPIVNPNYKVNYYMQTISGDYRLVESQTLQGSDREEITVSDYENVPSSHVFNEELSDSKTAIVLTDGSLVVDVYYKLVNEINVEAFSLEGCKNLQSLTVTFDAVSVNQTDVATLKLCDLYGTEKSVITAPIENGLANFNTSNVQNANEHFAIFTTQKTTTPTINSIIANYNSVYNLTAIYQDLASATLTDPNYIEDNVKFILDTDEFGFFNLNSGKWYSNGTLTSNVAKRPFYWNFTETEDCFVKNINLTNTMDHPGYMILRFTNVSRWTSGCVQLCAQQQTTGSNEINIKPRELENGVWKNAMHSFVYIGQDTRSHFVLGDMTVTWEKVLYSKKVTNGLENLPKYSLSAYQSIDNLTVQFGQDLANTEETATLNLLDATNVIVHTYTVGISNGTANFSLSEVENVSNYNAVIVTNSNQSPTIDSFVIDYKEVYNLKEIYANLYNAIISNNASEYDSGVNGEWIWCQKVIGNVNFVYQDGHKTRVDSNGKLYYTGDSTAAVSSTPMKLTIVDSSALTSMELTLGVQETGLNEWQIMSGDLELFKIMATDSKTQTIQVASLTNNEIKCLYWSNASSTEGYGYLSELVLNYSQTVFASEMMISK